MKKKIFSVFLCFLILLSFPVVSQAQVPKYTNAFILYDDGYVEYASSDYSNTLSLVSSWDYNQLDCAVIETFVPFDVSQGDTVSIKFYVENYQYYGTIQRSNLYITEIHGDNNFKSSINANSLSYQNGYLIVNFTANQDYPLFSFNISYECKLSCDSTSMDIVELQLTNIDVTKQSSDTTYKSGVIGWFQRLFDKISSGFSDLIAKITSIFDSSNPDSFAYKIKSGIENTIENVTSEFSSLKLELGEWFSGIGDRISGFFDNLWQNIQDKVDSIEQKLKDFKQEVSDWFDNLFKPEEGYFDNYKATWETWFSEHFGFLYDSYYLVIDTFVLMQNAFDVEGSGVIYIPSIDLPLPNASYTIVEEHLLDFNVLIQSHVMFSTLIEGFRMGATVLIYFGLVMYGKKSLEKILAEREL